MCVDGVLNIKFNRMRDLFLQLSNFSHFEKSLTD